MVPSGKRHLNLGQIIFLAMLVSVSPLHASCFSWIWGFRGFDPTPALTYREYVVTSALTMEFETTLAIRRKLEKWLDRELAKLEGADRRRFHRRNRFVRWSGNFHAVEIPELFRKGAVDKLDEDREYRGVKFKEVSLRLNQRGLALYDEAQSVYGYLGVGEVDGPSDGPTSAR